MVAHLEKSDMTQVLVQAAFQDDAFAAATLALRESTL
jgi:hypothetical protein